MYEYPDAFCFIFSKFPPVHPPNFSPEFCSSKYCPIFMKFGTHVLSMNIPTSFFSFFRKSPPFSPGGEFPPNFSPDYFSSKNCAIFMKFRTNVLCMNIPTHFFFFKIPPRSSPGGESPPKPPISEYRLIALKFGINALYHVT